MLHAAKKEYRKYEPVFVLTNHIVAGKSSVFLSPSASLFFHMPVRYNKDPGRTKYPTMAATLMMFRTRLWSFDSLRRFKRARW